MKRARWSYLVVLFAVLGLVSAGLAGQIALSFIRQSRYILREGVILRQNLVVEGAAVELRGSVDGDAEIRSIYFKSLGETVGTLRVWTGQAELRGHVADDAIVRAANARVYGTIDGDLWFTGGTLTIMEGATVRGSVHFSGYSLTVTATSDVGGITGIGARALVEGEVRGPVDLAAGRIEIVDGARLGGGIRYRSTGDAEIGEDVAIGGPVEREGGLRQVPGGSLLGWRSGWIVPPLLATLIVLIMLLTGAPGRLGLRAAPIGAVLRDLLWGAGVVVLVPVLLAVVAMYLITIPFVVLGFFAYMILLVRGLGAGVLALGSILSVRTGSDSAVAAAVVGIGLLVLAQFVTPIWLAPAGIVTAIGIGRGMRGAGAGAHRQDRVRRSRAIAGGLAGFVSAVLAVAALTVGAVATAASVVTLSGSASLVWSMSPIEIGVAAWVLASAAILIPVLYYESL